MFKLDNLVIESASDSGIRDAIINDINFNKQLACIDMLCISYESEIYTMEGTAYLEGYNEDGLYGKYCSITESFGEKVKGVWNAIVESLMTLVNKIKGLFGKKTKKALGELGPDANIRVGKGFRAAINQTDGISKEVSGAINSKSEDKGKWGKVALAIGGATAAVGAVVGVKMVLDKKNASGGGNDTETIKGSEASGLMDKVNGIVDRIGAAIKKVGDWISSLTGKKQKGEEGAQSEGAQIRKKAAMKAGAQEAENAKKREEERKAMAAKGEKQYKDWEDGHKLSETEYDIQQRKDAEEFIKNADKYGLESANRDELTSFYSFMYEGENKDGGSSTLGKIADSISTIVKDVIAVKLKELLEKMVELAGKFASVIFNGSKSKGGSEEGETTESVKISSADELFDIVDNL